MADEVIIGVTGDSGPITSYWLSDRTEPMHSGSAWSASYIRVPAALWQEYERLTARVSEIEAEFDRIERATLPSSPPKGLDE